LSRAVAIQPLFGAIAALSDPRLYATIRDGHESLEVIVSNSRDIRSPVRLLLVAFLAVLGAGCNDPQDPNREYPILGYIITGQADGTDPVTGEALSCGFIIGELSTGGPLIGTWTDAVTIQVIRRRTGPTQGVTYDTTLVEQQATITVPDSTHIQFSVSGPLAESLSAEMIPAYPGFAEGDWTCGPEDPLGRVQPDVTLPGRWHSQAIIDLPIG
jgi:hypothetical protein